MTKCHFIDLKREFETARSAFPDFYALGTPHEATLIDAVVVARASMLLGIRAQAALGANASGALAKATDKAESSFVEIRRQMMQTNAYRLLPCDVRKKLDLFTYNFEL